MKDLGVAVLQNNFIELEKSALQRGCPQRQVVVDIWAGQR